MKQKGGGKSGAEQIGGELREGERHLQNGEGGWDGVTGRGVDTERGA